MSSLFIFISVPFFSLNDRDLVIQGLVNLGFVLLGVGVLMGRELLITKKQWNLGKYILLNLVKEKHHMAQTILQKLCNYIVIGNNITQYIGEKTLNNFYVDIYFRFLAFLYLKPTFYRLF